jgi:F-type H+-transporting ATPase subunit b
MISINYAFIIVILNFVLLLIVLNKLLYKPIKHFLTERQKKIAEDIDAAKASKEEAKKLLEQKENELKTSTEEIRKLKNAALKDAEMKAQDILKNAKNMEKKILQETESQLEHEKQKVMHDIEGELSQLVAELTAKFLSGKLDEKNDKELINKMLKEYEKSEK